MQPTQAEMTAAYDDLWDPEAGTWVRNTPTREIPGVIERRFGGLVRPTTRSVRRAAQKRRKDPEAYHRRMALRGGAQTFNPAEPSCEPEPTTQRSQRWTTEPILGASSEAVLFGEKRPSTIFPPPIPVHSAPQGIQKWLIVPDTHAPYHDREAWATMIAAARTLDLHGIVVQGDLLDLYSVSSHDRMPHRISRLDVEIIDSLDCLDQLDSLGAVEKVYCFGNHENRLERFLVRKAPQLFGTVDLAKVLRLDDRGWTYHPYRKAARIGDLVITHDVGQHGKNAPINAAARTWQPTAIGHVHRSMMSVLVCPRTGRPITSACFGWLGSYDLAGEYKSEVTARVEWPHGFGLAYVEPDGAVHLRPVTIHNGRCIVEGRLVTRPGSQRWAA